MLTGCNQLRVEHVDSVQKKPGNVWVYLTVRQGDEPITDLSAEDFSIYEDGKLVSLSDSKQVIQDPETVSVRQTILLLDMSGKLVESGEAEAIVDAAAAFLDRAGKSQKVGVYAFDGSQALYPVVRLADGSEAMEGGLKGLLAFKPKDPSTNLHGAVVEALRELKRSLNGDPRPLKFGTLVVLSNGPDRATRIPREAMTNELEDEQYRTYELYAVGMGADIHEAGLNDVGRDGTEIVADRSAMSAALERVAIKVESQKKRSYLLSYCTPSRGGEHTLRIEARTKEKDPRSGSMVTTFAANEFGPPPECDPNQAPAFQAKAPAAPKPPEDSEKSAEEDKRKTNSGKAPATKGSKPPPEGKSNPKVIDWKPKEPNAK